MADNKHKPASFKDVKDKYLLTGKLFCGNCGKTMSGLSGTGKDNVRYRYYQCMASKKKICSKKIVPKNALEDTVINLAMSIFDNKDLVKKISNTCYKLQTNKGSQLNVLKRQLKQNKAEIDNVMNAIKAGIITKTTKKELEELEREQENIEMLIAQEQIERPTLSKEQIEAWIMSFAKTNLNSIEQKMKLIGVFVKSIFVYDDKMLVIFNYKNGEKCVSLDDLDFMAQKKNTHNECSSLNKFVMM